MKEGPEALVGGPPLSLSEGPALSAFRLRPLGRDAIPAFLEDVPSPLTLVSGIRPPRLPSKGLSATAEPTVLPPWGHARWGGYGVSWRRKKEMECFGPLLFGFYLDPLCFSNLAFGVYTTSSHPLSFPPAILEMRYST